MWPRFAGRRLLYITATILAIIFIITNLLKHGGLRALHADNVLTVQRARPLIWRTLQEHLLPDEPQNRTNDPDMRCRNSVQGRDILVDDRGFLCQREHLLLPSGCCDVEVAETQYYTCYTCNATTHCCDIYEYCVSCCLHPAKRALLELVLRTITGRQAAVFARVEDHFELCLVKCRTNSHSVAHENKYRDGTPKYCYGQTEAHESQREVSSGFAR
ncbi:SREBP regulating gene protein [Eurosta solidaginis]|uniref:SREBP regulating gene protein n=1 Tax=Eurosta solidaginis TaxID=178769 RepID=UPI0035313E37